VAPLAPRSVPLAGCLDSARQLESPASDGTLLEALRSGRGIHAGDWGMLAFVALPAVLFWAAYKRNSFWFTVPALTLDVVWLVLQIQSWWIPYIYGTAGWQLAYAQGPTTKVPPSLGHHVAPPSAEFCSVLQMPKALLVRNIFERSAWRKPVPDGQRASQVGRAPQTGRVQCPWKGRRPCPHMFSRGSGTVITGPNPCGTQSLEPQNLRNSEACPALDRK